MIENRKNGDNPDVYKLGLYVHRNTGGRQELTLSNCDHGKYG
ncbi:hypothetical protein ACFL53_00155 [Pseudomonadota bacterium]